jgi:hypothetical protein
VHAETDYEWREMRECDCQNRLAAIDYRDVWEIGGTFMRTDLSKPFGETALESNDNKKVREKVFVGAGR